MKRSICPPRKWTTTAIAAVIACMSAFTPTLSLAASATVNFGFAEETSRVSREAATTATTFSPVYNYIQTSTELDSTRNLQLEETGALTALQQTAKTGPKVGIGIEAIISDDLQIYAIPLSYSINRNFALQLNLPIVSSNFDNNNDGIASSNTGIGDVSLSLKHRIGSEHKLATLFSILTAKFASGDADKGLGTGTYDISLTEKVIKRFGEFRGTLMAGLTQPLNDPSILGSKVEYGTIVSYMAALEHTLMLPELWFGMRLEGLHSFETKIAGIAQGNALTTLDLTPEFRYFFKRNTSINLGLTVPVYTDFALQGGSSNRDVSARFGVSTLF